MRKYDPLMLFLDKVKQREVTLSYDEMEKIIGDSLPRTAYNNKNWWNNDDKTHTKFCLVGYWIQNL